MCSRKLQSQKSNFTKTMPFFSDNYIVKGEGHLHGGSLEVKAGLIRTCRSSKDLIQGNEVQLRALVGATSAAVLGGHLGLGSSMEHGGKSDFREMLKPDGGCGKDMPWRMRDGGSVRLYHGVLISPG